MTDKRTSADLINSYERASPRGRAFLYNCTDFRAMSLPAVRPSEPRSLRFAMAGVEAVDKSQSNEASLNPIEHLPQCGLVAVGPNEGHR